jgi:hypothetical protein
MQAKVSASGLIKEVMTMNLQCCGSGMFIPDPTFFYPGSRVKKIPDPGSGSASKNLNIFNPKNCFSLGNIIRDVHPGFGIPDPGTRIQGVEKQKLTGARIRIRNTFI